MDKGHAPGEREFTGRAGAAQVPSFKIRAGMGWRRQWSADVGGHIAPKARVESTYTQ
jgi:hypothetical protein